MEMEYTKTRDLYEAALLYAKHSRDFIGLEPDGSDFLFVFKAKLSRRTASAYYKRTELVNAKDYADAIRTCKDFIFRELRQRRL